MWLLPALVPGWFPHTAIDGSSTRALWTQLMGLVQFGLGAAFLTRFLATPFARWSALVRRGALATAEWQTDAVPAPLAAVDVSRVAPGELAAVAMQAAAHVPHGSVTLHGEHAALWHALNRALVNDHRLAQFSARVRAMVRDHAGATAHPFAAAMFRHHPQSFVHLVTPHLRALNGGQDPQQVIELLRDITQAPQNPQPSEQRAA